MAATLSTGHRQPFICKQLNKLPPVVSDWQQSCKEPNCPHFCAGECGNVARLSAPARCPFDGKELLLADCDA